MKKDIKKGSALKTGQTNSFPVWHRIMLVMVLILTFIVFSNTVTNEFLVNWDDDGYILNNPTVQSLNNQNIRSIFSDFHMGNYHPLTTLTYAVMFNRFKLNPEPYHYLNLWLHLANVLLVFFVVSKLTGKSFPGLICWAFFAVHPMHVESVAWISELKDVLYTFFFLGALLLYLHFNSSRSLYLYALSLLLFFFSLMSKSAAVVLPLVMIITDYYLARKPDLKSLLYKLPYFALSLLFGIIALRSQDAQAQHLTPDYSLINSFFVASYGLLFYIFRFFIPIQLSAFYPHPSNTAVLPLLYYLSPLIVAGVVYILVRVIKNARSVISGFAFYFVTVALVLQFFPVGGAVAADRYTYVPYIGLALLIAVLTEKAIQEYKNKKQLINGILVAVILVFSLMSYNRNTVWANGITLFDDVIEKQPQAFYAYHSRGIAHYYKGNYPASLRDYDQAITLNGNYGLTHYNRGLTLMMLKQNEEALKSFSRTIELIPTHDQAFNDRAIAHYNLNNFIDALKDYNTCLSLNPSNARAYYNRGVTSLRLNDLSSACTDWHKADSLGVSQARDLWIKYCGK